METGRSSTLRKYCIGLLVGALLIFQSASAEIYSCERNGVKEFSQRPCGDSSVVVQNSGEDSIQVVVPMTNDDIARICRLVIKGWDFAAANRREMTRRRYPTNASYVAPRDYVLSKITNLREVEKSYPSLYSVIVSAASRADAGGYPTQTNYSYQIDRDQTEKRCNDELKTRIDAGYRIRQRKPTTP
jgi:hypothetical protein